MRKNLSSTLRVLIVFILAFYFCFFAIAQSKVSTKKKTTISKSSKKNNVTAKRTTKVSSKPMQAAQPKRAVNQQLLKQIQVALTQIKNGQYVAASNALLGLSRRSDLVDQRPRIKYFLGIALMEMNLNQVASFQFVDVIRLNDKNFLRPAIEKLLVVTDRLGDETLLNYALQRVDIASIPAQHRDMLFYRMGEIQMKGGVFTDAISSFSKVDSKSRYYLNSLYSLALSQAEAGQTDLALQTFKRLLAARQSSSITDTNKVAAQMGLARVLYQQQKWDEAIDAYAEIPRDHRLWHDSIFERSWAMLRSGRFRSALSNFHSLHSSFYETFYIPESLLLRSIVYLYICKYDEMEKVLELYEKQYSPVENKVSAFLKSRALAGSYFFEVEKAVQMQNNLKIKLKTEIPIKALNHISEEGDVRRISSYIKKIIDERKRIEKNAQIKSSSLGSYAVKLLNNRLKNAKSSAGDMVKAHMQNMLSELKDLKDQTALIRYEMINGKKESIKKKIVGKNLQLALVDDDRDRSFYVQNGYEYYPFQGEYWLDEIGNYHYLGKQSCE